MNQTPSGNCVIDGEQAQRSPDLDEVKQLEALSSPPPFLCGSKSAGRNFFLRLTSSLFGHDGKLNRAGEDFVEARIRDGCSDRMIARDLIRSVKSACERTL